MAQQKFILDWLAICGTKQQFADAACILSLLGKSQLPADRNSSEYGKETPIAHSDHNSEDDSSTTDSDLMDESQDHREEATSRGGKVTEHTSNLLRNEFLTRLAETLARYKGGLQSKETSQSGPKHVSEAYMEEQPQDEPKAVEIFVTKNEGINEEDTKYLYDLKLQLEALSRNNTDAEEMEDLLLDRSLRYIRPRLEKYVALLIGSFETKVPAGTPAKHGRQDIFQSLSEQQSDPNAIWEYEPWNDYKPQPAKVIHAGNSSKPNSAHAESGKTCTDIQKDSNTLFEQVL
ncbi:uncharacterized protein K452DRAFT_308659 [Aplosporella prunicola CBS 121167]|uniref:Uncharacterized protein n=1 Tax=Aplosporella prunicola CBS 121167 TaxID=1176127 RepID=A0A6A6BF76_9PEZI|nr:uncharacterized protein K452DRAFT_308659 [Aplosporella prunicola CBS 121167]KAF2141557.1 hypothetical protein K452DRAFT_308659 [Aplosporella prunicola CBS 121167]